VPEASAPRFGVGATVEASSVSSDIETGDPLIVPGMSLAGSRLLARTGDTGGLVLLMVGLIDGQ